MHAPMEILSNVTTGTGSGSGVRQRMGSGIDTGASRFEKMFEEELAKYGSQIIEKSLNADDKVKPEKDRIREPEKDEHEDKTGETLAAGVMGITQNEVVFILEGDNESITTPEIRAENNVTPPETNQIVNPNDEAKPEINTTETSQFQTAYAQANAAVNTETSAIVNTAANTAANAETDKAAAKVEVNNENNTNTNGEVLARMPELRTQDSRNNAESNTKNDSKSFETGNLSPLENENDKTQEIGQREKTYSDAADAVKNATQDKAEPILNEIVAPPLSEGIKPEQFKAVQQMTEATLSTPVKTENLFQEMISRVETMQSDTKSTMTIQLNPEFLGKVALEVAVDAAGLHVKINAEDNGVRSMINGQLTALIESLENKGIEIAEVEVVYTGVNNGAFKESGENQQQQSRQYKPANREVNSADGVAFYTTLPDLLDYYLDTGVSSVEFKA